MTAMLQPLRRRLTLLFTALTALVLAGTLFLTWRLAAARAREAEQALLQSRFAALCDTLQSSAGVRDRWLAAQESAAGAMIFVQDGEAPLFFNGAGGWQGQTPREDLLALAAPYTQALGAGETVYFSLAGTAGEPYLGAAAVLRHAAGGVLRVTWLQQNDTARQKAVLLGLGYLAAWLLGVLALCLASRWLVGRALAPTALALQRQNEFVAAAGHELRSPLAVISASLDAARADLLPETERAALLRGAAAEAKRMGRLTDDLLLLAGADARALGRQLRCEPLAVDTICLEVFEQYGLLARKSGHPFTLELPEEPALPPLHADAGRLRQLLGILLDNAFSHTPTGTQVTLELQYRPARQPVYRFCVIDHGPGIPPGEEERIFDRFVRAEESRSDKAHFGLGLSVARELAALHGGRLWVQDTPGGGATFVLELPQSI